MNLETNLNALHDGIVAGLAAQFPSCSVSVYGRPGEKISTPAILIEIEDIIASDPDETGTEQLSVTFGVNAYAVLDYKGTSKKAVRALAASVMAFVRGERWGQPVGPANVTGAQPDVIAGREDDYEVMRVEFTHEGLLGADVWTADQLTDDEGEPILPPDEVFVSASTTGNEPDEPVDINCECSAP